MARIGETMIDVVTILFAVDNRGENIFLELLDSEKDIEYDKILRDGIYLDDFNFENQPYDFDTGLYEAKADVYYYSERQTRNYPGYEEYRFVLNEDIKEYNDRSHEAYIQNVAEIAFQYGFMHGKGKFIPLNLESSLQMTQQIIDYADEFENEIWKPLKRENPYPDNYLELIDQFIIDKAEEVLPEKDRKATA